MRFFPFVSCQREIKHLICNHNVCRRLKGNTEEIVEPKLKVDERVSNGNDTETKEEEKKLHLYEVSYWAK